MNCPISSRKMLTLCAALSIFPLITSTQAAIITAYSDRSSFNMASGFVLTETFNGFTTEETFHTTPWNAGLFTLSSAGTLPTDGRRNRLNIAPVEFPEFTGDGTNVINVLLNSSDDSLIFSFASPVLSFGADFGGLNDIFPRTAVEIAGVNLIPAVTATAGYRFFGYVSDTSFDTVTFKYNSRTDGFSIDNVAFAPAPTTGQNPVPEPENIAMLLAGFGIMAIGRRKHRQ
jgi:PEP-CTERM motif